MTIKQFLFTLALVAGFGTAAFASDPAIRVPYFGMPSMLRLVDDVYTLAQPAWEGRRANSRGGRAAREWIIEQMRGIGLAPAGERGGYTQSVREREFPWLWRSVVGVNVLGRLGEPRGPGSCILIGAHYDHVGIKKGRIFYGADDNASGVAAMLEIARLLKPRERELARCVVFAAWDHEEGSLFTRGGVKGSKYFVRHPTVPLSAIEVAVTFDLLGGGLFQGAERELFVFGAESSSTLRALEEEVRHGWLRLLPFSTSIIEPAGARVPRSDYGPFRSAGIPYLFFTSGTHFRYHTPMDDAGWVNYAKLAASTQTILEMLTPLFLGDVRVVSGEALAPRLRLDMEQAAFTIRLLLSNARLNWVAGKGERHLRENLAYLEKALEAGVELRPCELQGIFIDILLALEVHGTGSMGAMRVYLRATCD